MARTKCTCREKKQSDNLETTSLQNKPKKQSRYRQLTALIKEEALLTGEDEVVTKAKLDLEHLRHLDRKVRRYIKKERKAIIQNQEDQEIAEHERNLEIERRDRLRHRQLSSPIPLTGSNFLAPRPDIYLS